MMPKPHTKPYIEWNPKSLQAAFYRFVRKGLPIPDEMDAALAQFFPGYNKETQRFSEYRNGGYSRMANIENPDYWRSKTDDQLKQTLYHYRYRDKGLPDALKAELAQRFKGKNYESGQVRTNIRTKNTNLAEYYAACPDRKLQISLQRYRTLGIKPAPEMIAECMRRFATFDPDTLTIGITRDTITDPQYWAGRTDKQLKQALQRFRIKGRVPDALHNECIHRLRNYNAKTQQLERTILAYETPDFYAQCSPEKLAKLVCNCMARGQEVPAALHAECVARLAGYDAENRKYMPQPRTKKPYTEKKYNSLLYDKKQFQRRGEPVPAELLAEIKSRQHGYRIKPYAEKATGSLLNERAGYIKSGKEVPAELQAEIMRRHKGRKKIKPQTPTKPARTINWAEKTDKQIYVSLYQRRHNNTIPPELVAECVRRFGSRYDTTTNRLIRSSYRTPQKYSKPEYWAGLDTKQLQMKYKHYLATGREIPELMRLEYMRRQNAQQPDYIEKDWGKESPDAIAAAINARVRMGQPLPTTLADAAQAAGVTLNPKNGQYESQRQSATVKKSPNKNGASVLRFDKVGKISRGIYYNIFINRELVGRNRLNPQIQLLFNNRILVIFSTGVYDSSPIWDVFMPDGRPATAGMFSKYSGDHIVIVNANYDGGDNLELGLANGRVMKITSAQVQDANEWKLCTLPYGISQTIFTTPVKDTEIHHEQRILEPGMNNVFVDTDKNGQYTVSINNQVVLGPTEYVTTKTFFDNLVLGVRTGDKTPKWTVFTPLGAPYRLNGRYAPDIHITDVTPVGPRLRLNLSNGECEFYDCMSLIERNMQRRYKIR